MKGRPNIHNDKEIILKAQQVFWEKGYTATSLSDLSQATGAGAGSLYNTFKGGKKELFKRVLQQRREALNAFKLEAEQSDKPIDLIKSFFLELANSDKNAHLRGCIIANTVLEMTFIDSDLEQQAVELLKDTERLYTTIIKDQQLKGNIKSKLPADTLGKYLITLWCGINSLRRIYPDKDTLRQQLELQLQVIT